MTTLMILVWLVGLITGWRLRAIAQQLREQRESPIQSVPLKD